MFKREKEKDLSDEYLKKGYVIRTAYDHDALDWIREQFVRIIRKELNNVRDISAEELLNNIQSYVPVAQLNDFRLNVIREINAIDAFREMYYRVAKDYLDALVGNELAMQLRINLSIQLPDDDSSLLPVHADVWSGDSPYEVVLWIPLVDCYKTKAMYILPPKNSNELNQKFSEKANASSEGLYQSIKDQVEFLEVRYGEILIFDQSLPHGNRINGEDETRWSMNCRFKGVFTPYGDKKIGEFFEPITLRAASQRGMSYKLPELK